jgi:predicted nucleic acid-binding protein
MPAKVVDASAVAALLFNEPDAGRVFARIDGHTLVAPDLLRFEVASVCLKKIRKDPRRRDVLLGAFRLLERLDVDWTHVELEATVELADETGLTVYDACYLWVARLLRCELVTLDKRLAAAR